MAKIKNISALGDLYVPAGDITVKAGATVDVADELATALLTQTDNWAPADAAANSIAPKTTPDTPAAPVAPAAE